MLTDHFVLCDVTESVTHASVPFLYHILLFIDALVAAC